MYQSTDAFKNLVLQDSRAFKSKISYGDTTITNAKSIKLTGGSEGEDDFSLGSTVSQYITVTIPDPGKAIEGHELLVQIGMDVGGTTEYIPMGYFTAGKPKKDEEQIEFTAYDRMLKLETPFSMDGSSTDSVSVLKKIQEITRVAVITTNLPAVPMSVPKGYSCREVLSYIAQLYGRFAICSRGGQIELCRYMDSGYKVSTGRYWDTFEHNDYSFAVEKLTCFTGLDKDGKDISISSGTGTRSTTFSNPFMTQAILDDIMKKLGDFSYMPGSLKMLGDPRLDPWDVLTVEDRNGNSYKVPLMKLEWEFDGGFTDSVEAVGLSEEETNANYKGPSTKEMERYYAQLVMIDHAMINKLDVDTAKITYATITNLNAVNANVQKLYVEVGNFKQLTAADFSAIKAQIGILENDYGNIKVLLTGNAGIGDLQNIHLTTKNAVIDSALIRNAVIQTVTVADLLAGTISTNKFVIASDDGGIKIQGATQQWSDSNGNIRMQAGRDKNGDFTFCLFDKTGKGVLIDSTGIKPDAIADGLIVDSMVGDAANINAKKLDINSMFSVINGSTQTIKSSRIWMDEKNQTLNQVYSAITTDVSETKTQMATINTGLNGLKAEFSQTNSDNQGRFQGLITSISVIQGNLSALISDSEIKELKNGKVTMYSKLASAEMNISGLQVNFSDLSSKYNTVSGQYTSLNSKVASYKASLDGLSADLTNVSTNLKNNYSTTTAMNSAIKVAVDGVISTVSKTYVTTTTYNSGISDVKADSTTKANNALNSAKTDATTKANNALASAKTDATAKANAAEANAKADTAEKLKSYSTTTQMNSAISQKADSITSTVSKTYATKTALSTTDSKVTALETWKSEASLKITDSAIVSTVTKSTSWANKADKASVISQINQSTEKISISASKINLNGIVTANSYFCILTDGSIKSVKGTLGGWTISSDKIQSRFAGIDAMTIHSDGYLKFGTCKISSTGGALTVKNGLHIYTNVNTDSSGFDDGTERFKIFGLGHVSSGGHLVFDRDGATVSYLSSSSRRYKNHIRDMEDSDIENLYKLPTVFFTYKPGYLVKDSDVPIPGLYAEDVEKYLPLAARYQNGKIEDWNERAVIPYLIKAIQECHKEIIELKRKAG